MKKFFLLSFILISFSCSAQVDLKFLKSLILNITFDGVDRQLRKAGFPFDKVTKENSGGDCYKYYTFIKEVQEPFPYKEMVILYDKCEENDLRRFTLLRFCTRNEDLFYTLKDQCKNDGSAYYSEESKDGGMKVNYKNGFYTISFINTYNNGAKAYIVEVMYNHNN